MNRIIGSAIANSWFSAASTVLIHLISLPFVVRNFSPELVNLWFLFFSIISFSQALQKGVNSTLMRFITYSYSGIDVESFNKISSKFMPSSQDSMSFRSNELSLIISHTAFINLGITVFIGLALFFIGNMVLPNLVNELSNSDAIWVGWYFIIISTVVISFLGCFRIFLEGTMDVALVHRVIGLVNLSGLVLITATLWFNPTFLSLILIYQFLPLTVALILTFLAAKKIFKYELSLTKSEISFSFLLLVFQSAWKAVYTNIVANSAKHLSSIIVVQLVAPPIAASYQLTKRLFDIVEMFSMSAFQARIPRIAQYRSRGLVDTLIPYLRQTQFISYFVILFGYVGILILGPFVLSKIESNVDIGTPAMLVLFSLSMILSRWGGMALAVSNQANNIIEHICASLYLLSFILVVAFFGAFLGVYVFPLAQIVVNLLSNPVLIKNVYPGLNTTFYRYEKHAVLPAFYLLTVINIIYFMVLDSFDWLLN